MLSERKIPFLDLNFINTKKQSCRNEKQSINIVSVIYLNYTVLFNLLFSSAPYVLLRQIQIVC